MNQQLSSGVSSDIFGKRWLIAHVREKHDDVVGSIRHRMNFSSINGGLRALVSACSFVQ